MLGYPSEFKNDTHGQGVLNHILKGFEPHKGPIDRTRKGSLISSAQGETTAYALSSIEARGKLFITPGTSVYPGMIIGENSRDSDMEVNPVKAKQLTNIRAAGKDDAVRLSPPEQFTLEKLITYIQDDEVIEVVPSTFRIRKKELDANKRKTMKKKQNDFE